MIKTGLFAAMGAAGAVFVERDGALVAERFRDLPAECAAGRSGVALYDRSLCGVVSMAGRDTKRFCNGMFSNNVRDLLPGQSNRSVMLDDKGRIQGQLGVWCVEPDRLLIALEGVKPEAFIERYDRYIIADDVEMEDLSGELAQLSLQGPGAAALLARVGMPVAEEVAAAQPAQALVVQPMAVHPVARYGDIRVVRRARSRAGGYDLLLPRAELVAAWEALREAGAVPAGEEAQEVLRIEAGLARWPADMGERALLHELRMVADYANFNKGCYIGQEVINRLDVMGQVTKKLWGLEVGIDAIPPAGAEVRLGGEAVGVVSSGAREGRRVRVLAVLRKAAWKPGLEVGIYAGERSAPAVVCELPFPDGAGAGEAA